MNKKINVQNVDKLNKKFANVMTKLQSYAGTDPESVVQAAYNKYFTAYFGLEDTDIVRVEKCDSYFTKDNLTLLIEYKFDVDFSDPLVRSKVLAQTVFYYKRIIENEKKGNAIPNAVFIGDVNECFCLKTSLLSKHLNLDDVDYSVAPSSAGSQMALVNALMNDEDIKKSVFVINPQKDNMSYICEKLISISQNKEAQIPISKKNIHRVFETFVSKVVNDKKYDTNEIVGLFIDAIKHPDKRIIAGDMMVVHPYKPVKVFTNKAIALFNFFSKPSDEDAKSLAMIYDTLVKDSDRRKHGFFITPTIWVDLAHKYVADWFEKNGRDRNWEDNDNVVCWDCCCGTKSLTRNYRFKNLYLSTLEEGELNASAELSPEAKETFIFDFLNDPISKLPESLKNELKNLSKDKSKKLVFLTNPPYGQASGMGKDGKKHIVDTTVSIAMKADKVAYRGMDLFVQFLYRMNDICKHFKLNRDQVLIATFSNPTWLNGSDCQKFRKFWFDSWTYDGGFMFNASEFAGCSSAWGVKVTLMHNAPAKQLNDFVCDVYENTGDELKNSGTKCYHNVSDADNMDVWAKGTHDKDKIQVVALHSGITPISIAEYTTWSRGVSKMSKDSLAAYKSYGNVCQNGFACIMSTTSTDSNCSSIRPSNVDKSIQAVIVRNITDLSWLNNKDIYSKPDETNPNYQEWVKDCYANTIDSLVASMSGIVDGESYDYKNNFFPFSKAYTYQLLGKQLMKNEVDEKRWCLANGKFDDPTPEGKAVLDAFADCIKASAPYRDEYAKAHPELQLDHWDAGYRQLRDFLKETCKDKELKALKEKLKALKEKMRPMIYTLGFLKK